MKRPLRLATLAALLSAGFGLGQLAPDLRDGRAVPAGATARARADLSSAQSLSEAFREVAERMSTSVVSIATGQTGRRGFRNHTQGSGVIVRSDGVIVTNYHVVADHVAEDWEARRLVVTLWDGRETEGSIVGTDRGTDLAVLRVDLDGLAAAELSEHTLARVGEWVLAMGNPQDIGISVTAGIVGGVSRSGLGIAEYEDFIQTDAAINPGNSGGPLVNLYGELLGINTAMGIRSAGNNGFSFAIPVRMVRKVVNDILDHGKVNRSFLGINMRLLPPGPPEERGGYDGDSRVAFQAVVEDSPADRAGLLADDVLHAIHGKPVTDIPSVIYSLAEIAPGREIHVDVWRGEQMLRLPVTLAPRR